MRSDDHRQRDTHNTGDPTRSACQQHGTISEARQYSPAPSAKTGPAPFSGRGGGSRAPNLHDLAGPGRALAAEPDASAVLLSRGGASPTSRKIDPDRSGQYGTFTRSRRCSTLCATATGPRLAVEQVMIFATGWRTAGNPQRTSLLSSVAAPRSLDRRTPFRRGLSSTVILLRRRRQPSVKPSSRLTREPCWFSLNSTPSPNWCLQA